MAGDQTITKAGTVLDGVKIDGCVVVRAEQVVIKNSLISGRCGTILINYSSSLVITDSEIDGLGFDGAIGIGFSGFTMKGVEIRNIGDGVRANGDITMSDNWIHDFVMGAATHNDGVQITEGSNVKIIHNRIENKLDQTSAILIGPDQGSISNVTISNNLLAGGGYSLYGGQPRQGATNTSTDIRLLDNQFSRVIFAKGGAFGPIAYADYPGCTSTGNRWADTGQLL